MKLTHTLRAGDRLRNYDQAHWFGTHRVVRHVEANNEYVRYVFDVIGGRSAFESRSVASHSKTVQLFEQGLWKFDYPEYIRLPEGI